MNKRGDFTGVLFFVVSIAAFAIFLLIIGYIVPEIMNPLKEQMGISEEINNSLQAGINITQNTLPVLWFIMFGGLLLGLFVTAWFIPSHPIFAPIFGILMIVTIFVSIALSNAYEALAEHATLSSTAAEQGAIVFMMSNLPYLAFIIGVVILVLAYAKPGSSGGGSSEVPV